MFLRATLFLTPALLSASTAIASQSARADCLNDWGLASEVVKAESLLTVAEISGAAAGVIPGQIITTTLCKEAAGYVYRMVVRNPNGQLQTVVVDAQNHGQRARKR